MGQPRFGRLVSSADLARLRDERWGSSSAARGSRSAAGRPPARLQERQIPLWHQVDRQPEEYREGPWLDFSGNRLLLVRRHLRSNQLSERRSATHHPGQGGRRYPATGVGWVTFFSPTRQERTLSWAAAI